MQLIDVQIEMESYNQESTHHHVHHERGEPLLVSHGGER